MTKIDEYRNTLKSQLLGKRGALLEAQESVKQLEREALRIEGALMRIDEILAIHALDTQLPAEPETPEPPAVE